MLTNYCVGLDAGHPYVLGTQSGCFKGNESQLAAGRQ